MTIRDGRIRSASFTKPAQRDLPGALQVGLAGLNRDDVRQRDALLICLRAAILARERGV
jgi:hypothetical protein